MVGSRLDTQLRIAGWAAVSAVLILAPLNWLGWATGAQLLTRFVSTWPQMTPWTALWLAGLDSGYHWVDGHGKPYLDADGNTDGLITALRIVDDQVEAEQRLEQLARFDMLTGLANRAEAIARLEAVQALPPVDGTHLGILYCDVDHFKTINDTWGHGVGDAVLTTLAARICECVRRDDTVGRTGGDEILVLLPGVQSIDEAALIAEKIRCRVAEPIREAGHTIHVTLSIGATIALSGEPVAAITARADAAMYLAKTGNRNTVIRIEAAG